MISILTSPSRMLGPSSNCYSNSPGFHFFYPFFFLKVFCWIRIDSGWLEMTRCDSIVSILYGDVSANFSASQVSRNCIIPVSYWEGSRRWRLSWVFKTWFQEKHWYIYFLFMYVTYNSTKLAICMHVHVVIISHKAWQFRWWMKPKLFLKLWPQNIQVTKLTNDSLWFSFLVSTFHESDKSYFISKMCVNLVYLKMKTIAQGHLLRKERTSRVAGIYIYVICKPDCVCDRWSWWCTVAIWYKMSKNHIPGAS
mgnify:CR=1 FL=1